MSRLEAVRNDRVEFVTRRPPGSPFAALEREVVVTGPPELRQLAAAGDADVLDDLIDLLDDPERAWAAEVVLAAATGREAKQVDAVAARPGEWWDAVGRGAQERWRDWLAEREEA